MITGHDLIKLGYKPANWFKDAIVYCNDNNLEGEVLSEYLKSVAPKPVVTIEPLDKPVFYHKNIRAENELEQSNLDSVFSKMDEMMTTPVVVNGAVYPDTCPTGEMPVGSVIVSKAIHPSYHSADVCCSVMLTNLGNVDPKLVLDAGAKITHFGAGGRSKSDLIKFDLPIELEEKIKNNPFLNSEKSLELAKTHLGTQGASNHFYFVGKLKSTGNTVILTHSGSRAFGALLYKNGMIAAEKFRSQLSPNTNKSSAWIPYDTTEGKNYWEALQIVREWTKLNHTLIHQKTCDKVGVEHIERYWNEHNFVFKDENDLFYHAKGATPLSSAMVPDEHPDGLRIIPLNMKAGCLIVKGSTTNNNLGFAPHGAGRNMSRTQHKKEKEGKTVRQIFDEETDGLDIRFYSNSIDISELPSAYKNAESVKSQIQEFGLGEVIDEVIAYGCIMAGHSENNWRKRKNKNKVANIL